MNTEDLKVFARLKGWSLHKSGLYQHPKYHYKLTLGQIYREFR